MRLCLLPAELPPSVGAGVLLPAELPPSMGAGVGTGVVSKAAKK